MKQLLTITLLAASFYQASQMQLQAKENFIQKSILNSFFFDNFHAVEPGQCYRSNQPGAKELKKYIAKYGIKSVLNLRRFKEDKKQYKKEDGLAEELELAIYHVELSEKEMPKSSDIKRILEIFEEAPKPLLIHCWAGKDRSGLASALWVFEKMRLTADDALNQLRFKPFGHLKLWYPNMRKFIETWAILRQSNTQEEALMLYEDMQNFSLL